MGIEIEKKFTVKYIPFDLNEYPFHKIEQGYLNVHPAIRVRREDDHYYMTYKGNITFDKETAEDKACTEHKIGQTEYNMPLDKESYEHMVQKADGNVIRKMRYLIPINDDAYDEEYVKKDLELRKCIEEGNIIIELDVFDKPFEGRILAEIEFPSEEAARNYHPAEWFDMDVTGDRRYSNSQMSIEKR